MIPFQPIYQDKITAYKRFYNDPGALGCEANIVNAFLWNEEYKLRVAEWDDTLLKAYFRDDTRVWGYCLPAGKNIRGALELIFADAAERGQVPHIAYMTAAERETLETLFPGKFTFRREEGNQDYIYYSRDLATLPGKKYHAKRNHISKFYRTYGDDARFSTLDASNLADAMRVMTDWCIENGYDPQHYGEVKVFQKACACFDALGMHGGVVCIGDKPVAMTMGCAVSPACFDVMFEKALRAYDGVYAVINNAFAKTLTRYPFINREEDMNMEGLRKAKLSYHPAIVYDRFSALPL